MEKYSWDFNKDAEMWWNDARDTIEECIADAKEAIRVGTYRTDETPTKVYIGENIPFEPCIDALSVLEELEMQASDFAGELGEEWDAYDCKKQNELNELSESLTNVVETWLEKYGYKPNFYSVQDVKSYPISEKESDTQ